MTWLGNFLSSFSKSPPPPIRANIGPNAAGYISDGFPAPGLRTTQRLITGHNADGKGCFQTVDEGNHHRVMGEKQAVANILYSTRENPVDLNGDLDIDFAKNNEVHIFCCKTPMRHRLTSAGRC